MKKGSVPSMGHKRGTETRWENCSTSKLLLHSCSHVIHIHCSDIVSHPNFNSQTFSNDKSIQSQQSSVC